MIDFDKLLKVVVDQGASDLFVTAGLPPSIKVSGKMMPMSKTPLTADQAREMVHGTMTEAQVQEFESERECNFAIHSSVAGRFRVSAFYQRNFAGMVLRRIETHIPTCDELKLPEVIKNLAMTKRGLIIFVGATGTGKSTSLASMIGHRNTHSKGHIITIEDPIEYIHHPKECAISQREVGRDAKSFASALKASLREDPDVILVGELRDLETVQLAITAAETGHLVFGTLHTSGAPNTINRLIDVFPAAQQGQVRSQLAESLRLVVTQQLVKTADGQGRVAAFEIMVCNHAVRNLVREGKIFQIAAVMQTARGEGMVTMNHSVDELVSSGKINYEDVELRD